MALFNYYPYSNFHELNLDWLIKIVKKYTEETDALEIKVDDFIAYVTNYLDNLDVQEEIDQKLEEMKENGELAELIAEFLQTTSLIVFKTKALMKSAENLADGITVLTDGTDAYNDGETRLYYIRNITSSDVVDEINLVSLANYPTLVAEWLKDNYSGVFDSIKDEMVTYAEQNMDFNNTSVFNDIKDEMLDYVDDNYRPFKSGTITDIYVDAVNGSDNNDGFTLSTPLKTAQKAIEYVKKGYTAIFIHFMSNADYFITDFEFSNFNWHMSVVGELDNVVLHFVYGCRMYDCHVNWTKITVVADTNTIYQDSNYCYFHDMTFLNVYSSNGGILNMANCVLPQVIVRRTNFILTNCIFKGDIKEATQTLNLFTDGSIGILNSPVYDMIYKLPDDPQNPPAQAVREFIQVAAGSYVTLAGTPVKSENFNLGVTNSIRISGAATMMATPYQSVLVNTYPIYKVSPTLLIKGNSEISSGTIS